MIGFPLFAFVLCLSSVSAFWFRRNPPVAYANGRAINASCLAFADQGNCQFYTCFEQRLPCGRDWYILRTGQYYCNKIQREMDTFSPEGQQFLVDAQTCMMSSLKDQYKQDSIDCHELEHHAVSTIAPCFTENGFCDVLDTDTSNLFNVYEFSDLFSRGAAKVWQAVFALVARCGQQALQEFSSNTGNTINNLVDTIAN